MPVFPEPKFSFYYTVSTEVQQLRAHKATRGVPNRTANRLLVATWNIANLGAHKRRDEDRRLIAEMLSWFDLVAIQELRDNFADLDDIRRSLGAPYKLLFSDVAGNNERMAFVYDSRKLTLLEKIGEISIPPSQLKHITIKGVRRRFDGFDRNPYLAAFQAGQTSFMFVNVHLFFGSEKKPDMERRALETFAVARWAQLRNTSRFSYTREIVALGDFNMPKAVRGDAVFDALVSKGLEIPAHSSGIGSSIASDKHYDQVAFFPGTTQNCFTRNIGVFDYDAVIFKELWDTRGRKDFNSYLRYYMSDHRPLWFELRL